MRLISIIWVALAAISFSLGLVGIFLPLMPTTIFMLIAVYCASKGSPRFEAWIRSRDYVGPLLITWEQERAIPRRAKLAAVSMIALSALIVVWSLGQGWLRWGVVALLVMIALWLATRPEPSSSS
ncbi:YbaN family protein [Vreelandella maris]|uniref:Inner membrane protein n=1 Tax=Vreelandella maris TaxID=2729617 RepID=A0A7Y6RE40_9GAMM|nr:YbaN family protein [Halomonas maris]NVF15244.1 YbaN family protein [Halomonas maris]|tara:strand:+ start:138 stop:512 length:375 start_codon:yes stop_codon:yes gene_type:complete